MLRCLELAEMASGMTAPNPIVGAVIVFEDRIIGEGYHQKYGDAHAEVNAINDAIKKGFASNLKESTLYVNLEPCSHHGKTPPCTDLIIQNNISKVVIGCKDHFEKVSGKGILKLNEAGIKTEIGLLENECEEINRRFITYHTKNRPFILLKYAQTINHYIATRSHSERISNSYTDILSHKWRSEESAIMVGTRTAEIDNPMLTVRNWKGNNPLRIVIDKTLRLPTTNNLFDNQIETLVFNNIKNEKLEKLEFIKIDFKEEVIIPILQNLYERNILSVMIEGGSNLLNQFITLGLWDEARIITADKVYDDGIPAPVIKGKLISSSKLTGDLISIFKPWIKS
jgi:diaminohydroxyphosphoribosylaminopyrimidine deaminase/5-amino-6-(5-phosphoribosylamino)uracil reductase